MTDLSFEPTESKAGLRGDEVTVDVGDSTVTVQRTTDGGPVATPWRRRTSSTIASRERSSYRSVRPTSSARNAHRGRRRNRLPCPSLVGGATPESVTILHDGEVFRFRRRMSARHSFVQVFATSGFSASEETRQVKSGCYST